MSTQPPPVPASAGRVLRVEYLDFKDVGDQREFRLRVCGPDGSTEYRLLIALAAFRAGRVRLQDGPEVCYQKLLRAAAAGETASPAPMTIDDVDLALYHEAHTKVTKHRARTPSASAPLTPDFVPRRQPRPVFPRLPVAPSLRDEIEPALEEGQRVSHAVHGVGVTASSKGGHTVVSFDQHGLKTFVTSLLKVDVLSAPHTWETTPRGKNRPCASPPA
jgi:hypothetical protein